MLNIINQKLTAGRRWYWEESLSDYAPSLYTLEIILKKADGSPAKITTSESSGNHLVDVAALTTAAFTAGYFVYSAYVFEIATPTNIIQIESGIVEILADPIQSGDVRTFAQKVVDKLEAVILAVSGNTMSSVSIDGRTYTYKDEMELIKKLEYWQAQAGLSIRKKRQRILTQFTNH